MKKEISANETQPVLIPVLIDMDSIKEHGRIAGMDGYKITMSRVCNRILPVVLVPGTKEQYDAIMSDYSREFKAEDRDKRCAVPGKDGKLIRCPDDRKCSECPFKEHYGNCSTITFSGLSTESDDGEILEFEAETPDNYYCGDREMRILADLIDHVTKIDPEFGTMIQLLHDGKSRRQVADEMGLPKSTVIDRVSKLRKITEEFLDNLAY